MSATTETWYSHWNDDENARGFLSIHGVIIKHFWQILRPAGKVSEQKRSDEPGVTGSHFAIPVALI
jgi:hypothetical protein